jgi:hypothetical protein
MLLIITRETLHPIGKIIRRLLGSPHPRDKTLDAGLDGNTYGPIRH